MVSKRFYKTLLNQKYAHIFVNENYSGNRK